MFAKSQNANSTFRRIATVLLVWLVTLTAALPQTTAWASPPVVASTAAEDIYKDTLRGTAFLVVRNQEGQSIKTGTAWIADLDRGYLMTNRHVVSGASRIDVYFPQFRDGKLISDRDAYQIVIPATAEIVDSERHSDLAIVQVDRLPDFATALPLAPESAGPASRVHTIGGLPEGSSGLFSYVQGVVRQVQNSGRSVYGNRLRTIETNLGSNPGNSGGAMVNDQGHVVGIVSRGLDSETMMQPVVSGADIQVIREYLERVRDLMQLDTADRCYQVGQRHLREERYTTAIGYFSKAIEKDQKQARFFEGRARAFYLLDDLETALSNANRAIDLDDRLASARDVRASILADQSQWKASLKDWTTAISIDPNGFRYSQRADVLNQLKQTDLALSDLDRAIDLEPDFALHRARRVLALAKLNQSEEANREMEQLIQRVTHNHRLMNEVGLALFEGNHLNLSFQAFSTAAQINQTIAQYPVNAGIALRRLGKHQLALKWYEWALKIDPDHEAARQGRRLAQQALQDESSKVKPQRETSHRTGRRSSHPIVGTWAYNVTRNSTVLHSYISLAADGTYSGVHQGLNDDGTVHEELMRGTWNIEGDRLTITRHDGRPVCYTVRQNGDILKVYDRNDGQYKFSYRRMT